MNETKTEAILRAEKNAEKKLDALVSYRKGQRRDPQIRLAKGMARHQTTGTPLIVQAPTGSGKSYAAIAASISSDEDGKIEPTIISTHNHALQQQLQDDATMLSEASGDFFISVLKGRSSYYCKLKGSHLVKEYKAEAEEGKEFDPNDELHKVLDWSEETETGDKSELSWGVSNETWQTVSVSSDQCAGTACPVRKACFAEKARAEAKKADLLITNHAMVSQGMKQETFLDGRFTNIVIDEAHEFAGVVSEAFGATVSRGKLKWIGNQARRIASNEQMQQYENAIERILSYGRGVREPLRHLNDHPIMANVKRLSSLLAVWIVALDGNKGNKDYILKNTMYSLMQDLDLIAKGDTKSMTAWIEWQTDDTFVLRSNMFNPGLAIRQNLVDNYKSSIFMSATIKTGSTFNPAASRLGLNTMEWTGAEIPHQFDYENNGLIWLPSRMKDRNDPGFLPQVAMVSKAAIGAAQGRTLILCTSWKGVNTIGEKLRSVFNKKDFPIIMQQPGVNMKPLAAQFKDNEHSVLIGTASLWAGMSFEGDTCACVIMDKIPFPSPADPIIAARCEEAEDNDINSFATVMVPEAATKMAQGAGRLIRTPTDRGVLIPCDPALNANSPHYKQYAPRILKSLPPMPITHDTDVALERLSHIHNTA